MANGGFEKASLVGGALAAIVASVCCLGPFVLVTVGISGAWISNLAAFEPYRPYAIGVALVCMAFAYRKIYAAPAPEACEPGTLCAVPQTRVSNAASEESASGGKYITPHAVSAHTVVPPPSSPD